jgi:signal transduction histidine kinase
MTHTGPSKPAASLPRLLFVDDDPGVLSAVARFLRRYRFDVHTVLSAEDGLRELHEQGPFSVVVSDYRMPGMTGEQFLAKVAEEAPDTRRMILSAYADSDQLLAAINAGRVHRYLTKPWDSQELLEVINELVGEYRAKEDQQKRLLLLTDVKHGLESALQEHDARLEAQGRFLLDSNSRLRQQAARMQQIREDERRAIARDIHDDLGQTLTAMNLELAVVLHSITESDLRVRLQSVKQQVDAAIGTVQRIIGAMRPPILDELGLEAALEALIQDVRVRGNMKGVVSCTLQGEVLPSPVVTCLYRIAQEALTNVLRHAHASKILLTARRRDGWTQLQIRDNGIGIPRERETAADAFGLMGMRERVTQCGGSFSISPRVGGGTIVEAQVPDSFREI